jgi:hypothetical protein
VTSEPVVVHHGREEDGCRSRRGAADFNSLLAGAPRGLSADCSGLAIPDFPRFDRMQQVIHVFVGD